MSEMLTAKDMQALLQVDRSTIYRMAEAGQLPAIKVGKQWRFPLEQVESMFHIQVAAAAPGSTPSRSDEATGDALEELLPLECVQLIQDTFAELLGAMLVITDLNGRPITEPSNPCGLFQAISQVPHALERCIDSWHDLADSIDLQPHYSRSHLEMLCARAMIRDGAELKGMVVAGCVAPDSWPPDAVAVGDMATQFGVAPRLIQDRLEEVHRLSGAEREQLLFTLQRVASIVAHIVKERKTLVTRLEAIAELTSL